MRNLLETDYFTRELRNLLSGLATRHTMNAEPSTGQTHHSQNGNE
jgi:hypothetical protein